MSNLILKYDKPWESSWWTCRLYSRHYTAILEEVLNEHVGDTVVDNLRDPETFSVDTAILEKVLDEHVGDTVAHELDAGHLGGTQQVNMDFLNNEIIKWID